MQALLLKQENNSVYVNIETVNKIITIGCQYSPPSSDFVEDLQEWNDLRGHSNNFLLCADLNAHSPIWGYPQEDDRGRALIQQIGRKRLIVINNPHCDPTFETTISKGWPDVSLSSMQLFDKISDWSVKNEMDFADHRLITIVLTEKTEKIPQRRYRTKYANFKKFIKEYKEMIKQNEITFTKINTMEDLEKEYRKFEQGIQTVAENTLKKKNFYYTPSLKWWTPNLRKQRNYVAALYKKHKLNNTEESLLKYRRQRAIYKRMILEGKRKKWIDFCTETSNPYSKIKDVAFNKLLATEVYNTNQEPDDVINREAHFKHLTTKIFGQSVETILPSIRIKHDENKITHQEIRNAMYSFNRNKAPGYDNIDHPIIRTIYKTTPDIIRNMYNAALSINHFIDSWKIGEIVYFHKQNKPISDSKSYRPITLLPIMGKIYEKIILKRIKYFLHLTQSLNNHQHGFCENRSTETAIQYLLSIIDINLFNNCYTSLISIDFQGAFDNLQWKATIEYLKKLNIPIAYIGAFQSYLSKRRSKTHWRKGGYHYMFKGCPQGSVFGPFLWTVQLNDLLNKLEAIGIKFIAYADDVILIINGQTRNELEDMGKRALNLIELWAAENDQIISIAKSQVLNITRGQKLKRPPIFKIYNQTIQHHPTIVYLGVTIDEKLTFLPHVKDLKQNVLATTQNLLRFTSREGSINSSILKIWYKTILERKIVYASPVWFKRLQKAHGQRVLQSAQYNCLLLISKAYNKTSYLALCTLTGISPIVFQLTKESTIGRLCRLGENVGRNFASHYQYSGFNSSIPPYIHPIRLKQILEEETEIIIYTDGSKQGTKIGYAFCSFKQDLKIKDHLVQLSKENSIFQAELQAISDSIDWALTSSYHSFTIVSDSQSSITALQDTSSKNIMVLEILQKLHKSDKYFIFQWTRAHVGTIGNEIADSLARKAAKSVINIKFKFIPYPASYFKHKVKCKILQDWQTIWDEADRGRYTYNLLPKVSDAIQLSHRNLFLFSTNHGPFPSYLYAINRIQSNLCVCGDEGNSLHYILRCPRTARFHIKKSINFTFPEWFNLVINNTSLKDKIIKMVKHIESDEVSFQSII